MGDGRLGATTARIPDGRAPTPDPAEARRPASYLPSVDTLDDESFRERHTVACWVLALHVPALLAFGLWRDVGPVQSVAEAAVPALCLVAARLTTGRRVAACLVTAGLVAASTALAYMSGGSIEARFHVFVVVALVALYRDGPTLAWAFAGTAAAYLVGVALGPDDVFDHHAGQDSPLVWTAIHLLAVLAACAGVALIWHAEGVERRRAAALATRSADAQVAVAQAEAAQRTTVSELLVHLARRNQALLDRQLELIAELEQHESTPESLADLFRLDHLATRIRRNAESLLVLSGEDPPRRWGRPVPLGEVVRAAAAEVEDYDRVEALVSDHLDVAGRAVADLAHLLAELIENATTFSPPTAEVRVRSHPSGPDHTNWVVSIEDTGAGMAPDALDAANRLLADPPAIDLTHATLGFQVVARLARRYRLQVRLTPTPGGGLTALVVLPADLVTERSPAGAGAPSPTPAGAPGAPGGAAGAGPGRGDAVPPLRPGSGLTDWRLPDAETLGRMVAPTPPSARRSAEVARGLRGMAVPRIGAEEVPGPHAPPGPAPVPVGTPPRGTPVPSAPPVRNGTPPQGTPVPNGAPPGEAPSTPGRPPLGPPDARRLTRRVPGQGLRDLGDDPERDRPPPLEPPLDVERMRTMIERLQDHRGERSGAGTGAGTPPAGTPPDERS